MVSAGDGLSLRFRDLQTRAGKEPVQVASELVRGSTGVLDTSGPTPNLLQFAWFHVPISRADPGHSTYDRQVFLDFIQHSAVLNFSVLVQAVGSVHRHKVHGSMAGPRYDSSRGPMDLVPPVNESREAGEHSCASAPSSEEGSPGFVPYSMPTSFVSNRLHAWQVGGDQSMLLNEKNATSFGEGVEHGFSASVDVHGSNDMVFLAPSLVLAFFH